MIRPFTTTTASRTPSFPVCFFRYSIAARNFSSFTPCDAGVASAQSGCGNAISAAADRLPHADSPNASENNAARKVRTCSSGSYSDLPPVPAVAPTYYRFPRIRRPAPLVDTISFSLQTVLRSAPSLIRGETHMNRRLQSIRASIPLVMTLLLTVFCLAPDQKDADESGFKPLFNGKDLTNWKGDMKRWSVQDGAITGKNTAEDPLKYNTFLVYNAEVSDFELRFSYKIVNGNSGVQYRSKLIDPDKFIVGGYQADIDSSPTYTGINYDERGRAILATRGQRVTIAEDGKKTVDQFGDAKELQEKIKKEDWNDYVIIAKGNNLKHIINGTLMSEVTDNQTDKAAKSGILAIQVHAGPPMTIQVKDIRIKELKAVAAAR